MSATPDPAPASPPRRSSRGGLVLLLVILVVPTALCAPMCILGGGTKSVGDDTVLELDLEQQLDETGGEGPLPFLHGGEGRSLLDVVLALEKAKTDPKVKGLVARVGASTPMATVQELRDAVTSFRASGKPAIAWSEGFGEMTPGVSAYALATAFDEIWLQPSGDVGLTGLFGESMFMRGALDKLGVEPEMSGRKEFKNAVNQFTETTYTPAHREAVVTMLQSLEDQIAAEIAAGRKGLGDKDAVKALLAGGPLSADEALKKGLVDKLGYRDEVMASLKQRFGEHMKLLWVQRYVERSGTAWADEGKAPVVALVVAKGSVTRGKNGVDPLSGGESFGSDTVGAAIRAAAADPDVKVILLRVDSPGGSYVASDTLWRAVKQAQAGGKKVVASMGDMAASGGYFMSMAADKIVAEPATLTGSIGVFAGKMVTGAMWEKIGVNFEAVATSPNVDVSLFSNDVPYSDAAKAHLEAELDRIYLDFTKKAADGRKLPYERLEPLAHGRVWTGAEAKERGLVDELGGFLRSLEVAREVVGLDKTAEIRVRPFPKQRPPLAELLAVLRQSSGDSSDDADTNVEMRGPAIRALRAALAGAEISEGSAGVLTAPVPRIP